MTVAAASDARPDVFDSRLFAPETAADRAAVSARMDDILRELRVKVIEAGVPLSDYAATMLSEAIVSAVSLRVPLDEFLKAIVLTYRNALGRVQYVSQSGEGHA